MRKDLIENRKKRNKQVYEKEQQKQTFPDEEYIRRAEEMEKALLADENYEEDEITEEEEARSYEVLINRLKADGIYKEDETLRENIREVDFSESSVRKNAHCGRKSGAASVCRKKYGRVRLGRVAGIAILCCACVFAASMTSEANRNYFVKEIQYLTGDDTRILVYNDEENESSSIKENQAIEDIESQLGIELPQFYYRPTGFEFVDYKVNADMDVSRMEYEYKENRVVLLVDKQTDGIASNIISMQGKNRESVLVGQEELQVSIEQIQDKQDLQPCYNAVWERNNIIYCLSGKLEKTELKKILEQMKF